VTIQNPRISVSSPGRICLFGEHHDYLGLPVITAAINRRIFLEGNARRDRVFHLDLPDIGQTETIDLSAPIRYIRERDYFRSGLNVLLREGLVFDHGFSVRIRGTIPINSGTSSSSALMVAWIAFLLAAAGDGRYKDPPAIARLAHSAEVVEFNEPGGMMDHMAASLGGVLYIRFTPSVRPGTLPAQLGAFILGDSLEPKDTKGILYRVRKSTQDALEKIRQEDPDASLFTIDEEYLAARKIPLSAGEKLLLNAQIVNRDLTIRAAALLSSDSFSHKALGALLNAHHEQLRDGLKISTPKIDRMIGESLKVGALGAKINGSGGGGCMFAYAPDSSQAVAEAIARAGGKPYPIEVDRGVEVRTRPGIDSP
jgi:galactokinase